MWVSLLGTSLSPPPPLKPCSAPPYHSPDTPTSMLILKNTNRHGRGGWPALDQAFVNSPWIWVHTGFRERGWNDSQLEKQPCLLGWPISQRKSWSLRASAAFVFFSILTQTPFVSVTEIQTHTQTHMQTSSAEYEISRKYKMKWKIFHFPFAKFHISNFLQKCIFCRREAHPHTALHLCMPSESLFLFLHFIYVLIYM